MSKEAKTNLYYLEDNQDEFDIVQKGLQKRLPVKVFPENSEWKTRLRAFEKYQHGNSRAEEQRFVEELLENKIALIILDQQVNGFDHVGANVFDQIIREDPRLKSLKVIIFSGAKTEQRSPGLYLSENLIVLPKKEIKKSIDPLVESVKTLLTLDDGDWFDRWINVKY